MNMHSNLSPNLRQTIDLVPFKRLRVALLFQLKTTIGQSYAGATHFGNVSVVINFFTKDQSFYLDCHKFSIKSYVFDVY